MKLKIDSYGRREGEPLYCSNAALPPIETETVDGVGYFRYEEGVGPIHRMEVDATGMVVTTWAWGEWADRATLDYIADDRTREVEA